MHSPKGRQDFARTRLRVLSSFAASAVFKVGLSVRCYELQDASKMESPSFLNLNRDNVGVEHICCAIGDPKHQQGVACKKNWLSERFDEGMIFRKLTVRGKVFIEYCPAEYAWRPVIAPGYWFIHCIWVSGRFKNAGHGRDLLQKCLDDAKGSKGVAVVASKKPFLTDSKFFAKHGFSRCDDAPPYFDLMVKRFDQAAELPRFSNAAKQVTLPKRNGLDFFYTDQCPFVYRGLEDMENVANEYGLRTRLQHLTSRQEVLESPSPYGTFGVFLHGQFLTHELMSKDKFTKIIAARLTNN